jgi:hypothetical protein
MARWISRSLEDDDSEDKAVAPSPSEPEYAFEGFNIDFSTKVMLTPPAQVRPGNGNGAVAQTQSRRR